MEFLIDNWILGVIVIALGVVLAAGFISFANLPSTQKNKKIKEWLLYAVFQAEVELGEGKGSVKLRHVYDKFVDRYKWVSLVISFEKFSRMVDEALSTMKKMLEEDEKVNKYVEEHKDGK